MNSRERLTRCYFHQETDRPAVYTRTAYPANDPTYDKLKEYMNMMTDLKKLWQGNGGFSTPYPTIQSTEAYSNEYDRVITKLTTPAGDLYSSVFSGIKGMRNAVDKYFIEDKHDAEKYLSLGIPEVRGDIPSFYEANLQVGDRGIVEVYLGSNPAGFTVELIGSENFAIMTMTDRDILHELCQYRMNIIINIVKFLVEKGVGPFFAMQGEEYLVPPIHGIKDFYDFNVKYDKPIIDLIHEAGGRVHVHSHGSIKKVLQGFVDMGVDVLHPFETPPQGDITAKEAKKVIEDKICIEGNIQISNMYENTPKQIREETEQLIKEAFIDNKGLIVSASASPYIPGEGLNCLEQYKAMVETVISSC